MPHRAVLAFIAATACTAAACAAAAPTAPPEANGGPPTAAAAPPEASAGAPAPGASVPPAGPAMLVPTVLEAYPHDPEAFTQGLLLDDGKLYESTGLEGRSTLREVDPATGKVLRRHDLPADVFAEGLALVDDRLVQLSWQEQRAFVYDERTFTSDPEFAYAGEGWGLCYDGRRLVMSNGSDRLTFRDPATFEVQGDVGVTLGGQPLRMLNELECVDGQVYANVWQTNEIVAIDPASGRVTASVDASNLWTQMADRDPALPIDVLNGIAYDPADRTFLVTGKLWPKLFRVRFDPATGTVARRAVSRRPLAPRRAAAWLAVGAVAAAVGASPTRTSGARAAAARPMPAGPAAIAQFPTPRPMGIEVLATHPHDRRAYTQGLVWDDGTLFESTGLYGESSLRRVALATGEVLQRRDNDGGQCAEGLALVGDQLVQLTWQTHRAFVWDKTSFEPRGEFEYGGEGWGLCRSGEDLVMSDGSDTLFIRDAKTFAIKDRVPVQIDGEALAALNELECVGDSVYANVWSKTFIVKIELATGDVTERIDGAPLDRAIRAAYGFADPYDCLNGIAYMPEAGRFLITGKHWPELYEVRFVPEGEPTAASPTASMTPPPTSTATATAAATPHAYLPWAYRPRP
ncbi:MAG: glutaminyl-peptide cyclotransferase [Anaerolineae bacterium]